MIDVHTLLIFGVASFALCVTPGPDILLIAARSAAQGRTAGLLTHLGVAAGSAFHAILLAVGLSQLFLAVPHAYDTVRLLGAAYLLYLAWSAFTERNSFSSSLPLHNRRSYFVIFKQGFYSNLLNPKVALFYLALFPQFLDPNKGSITFQVLVLALVLQVVGLLVHGVAIWLAGGARRMLEDGQRFAKLSWIFLGTMFGALAARLVFDDSR